MHRNGETIPAITGDIDYKNAIHIFPKDLLYLRSSIIAYGSSLVSTFVGFPLDTIKVRMQTHKEFTSYYDCIRKTLAKEGIRGFYRGVWAPLISTSFSKSLSVSIYSFSKPYVYNSLFNNSIYHNIKEEHPFIRNLPVCFISGLIAGGCVSIFACPFEFIKVYAQLEKLVGNKVGAKLNGSSTIQIMKNIIKYKGITGLYSGFKLHLIRDSLSTGMYYSFYESVKLLVSGTQSSPFSILLAGGLSGVISWIIIFPVDTAKSIIQNDVVKSILSQQHGISMNKIIDDNNEKKPKFLKNSYRGLGISVARSFITSMVFFGTFELGMKYLA
ncbi:uncharacterized protein KGF55_000120 [Candida pseudojiufengensis]|uniref:uncharacterized protein n=1 Tax=Candida pseudojiufengensis TaxID=497109 RepID=UPI00222565A1|nr:uncharacterized protein KGF55_000120 [Candida pseudojiufengensis]KAI5966711.1 hypothetical protein KGF55_000120 [Candida pseudojiufengensis]